MREQVFENKKTYADIAKELNVGKTTVREWGDRFNIEVDRETHNWRGKRKETINRLEENGIL